MHAFARTTPGLEPTPRSTKRPSLLSNSLKIQFEKRESYMFRVEWLTSNEIIGRRHALPPLEPRFVLCDFFAAFWRVNAAREQLVQRVDFDESNVARISKNALAMIALAKRVNT